MKQFTTFRKPAALLAIPVLAAGCSTRPDLPDYFTFRLDEGRVHGSYNPAGYSSEQVRTYAGAACVSAQVREYEEEPSERGLVAFTASCEGRPLNDHAFFEVKRVGNSVVAEGVMGVPGDIVRNRKTFPG